MSKSLLLSVIALLATSVATGNSVGLYLNQADWQAAMSLNGANSLTNISFNASQWSSTATVKPGFTGETSSSSQDLVITSGFSTPGYADPATLGHISNGSWSDNISKYGVTTFSFATPIYGFGGDFAIADANGLYLSPVGSVNSPFIGVILENPISSFQISWGDLGTCSNCFSNSYTLTNVELGILPTPEPHYGFVIGCILLATAISRAYKYRASIKSQQQKRI